MRYGRQEPTQALVLPYTSTRGMEAVEAYEQSGKKAYDWQALQLADIMAVDDNGLWVHQKYGLSVPRRNGKNEVVVARELWGLLNGEHICHTAHRTTTSHSAWVRLCKILADLGYTEVTRQTTQKPPDNSYKTGKQYGLESIALTNGGEIVFRTRTTSGGLGEGFDLLVIDEAQEYTDSQESALIYTVTDSMNPQTLYCGTPPTATSAGTVFLNMRSDCLTGESYDSGWAEWSIPAYTDDYKDVDLWYETNPSMGYHLTERKIRSEIKTGKEVDFNIQRLGVWLRYNQKSSITEGEWDALQVETLPEFDQSHDMYVGIKYSKFLDTVAMTIAIKTQDGNIFVESIDCRSTKTGDDWILAFLQNRHIAQIVIDGASGQETLRDEILDAQIYTPVVLPRVAEIIKAHRTFEQELNAGTIIHMDQPALRDSVSNCEKRPIGSAGGWGYKSLIEDVDCSLLDSTVLAVWAARTATESFVQEITY